MQIHSVSNIHFGTKRQNFKGSSVASSPFLSFPSYQPTSLNTSKAYVTPQITQGYKEIKTFDVPYVGKGKLYQLSNGHKLAIVPKAGPFVINTLVKAGQDDDPTISHFVEHLVYNFETQVGGESLASFQRKSGIDSNAETNSHYTNYWMKYPFNDTDTIDKIIKTQAQLIQYPTDFKTRMGTEKGILISEETINLENKINHEEEIPFYLMLNTLLGINEKPRPQLNSIEQIKNSTLEELEAFHTKYYNNNNMVTFVVGDVNPDQIAKSFAKSFDKPNDLSGIKLERKKENLSKSLEQTKRFDINTSSKIDKNIRVGFVGPKNDDIEGNFLQTALKLYIRDVKNNENLALSGIDTMDLPTENSIVSLLGNSQVGDEEKVLENIYKYASNLTQNQISDWELDTLKIKLKGFFTSTNEGAAPIALLGGERLLYSNKIDLFEYSKLVDKLTKEDLQNFAKKYFDLNKAVVIVVHENQKDEKSNNSNKLAFTGNTTTLDTSSIVEYAYPNNLQLIVDTSPAIAKTSFRLDLVSNELPEVKPGVSRVLAFMLMDNFENHKSKYPYISGPELKLKLNELGLMTTCAPEDTLKTVKLLKKKLLSPTLTNKSLDDTKKTLKEYYKISYNKNNQTEQKQKFHNYNYVDNSINGLLPEEYSKMIDDINFDDIITFHKQLVSKSQGKAILVMPQNTFNSQKKEIIDLVGSDMPLLQPKQKIDITNKISVPAINLSKVIIELTNNNNAKIQQDFQIPLSGDLKEELSVKLISIILGEQRDSRLEADIRGKQGLSYTTGSLFDSDGRLGYLSLMSSLPLGGNNAVNLQKVLETFKININDLTNNSVSNEELERAKTTFKSQIIQHMEYSSGRNDVINDYGIDNTRNLFQALGEITPKEIQNASKKFLDKPALTIIKANKDVIDSNKDYLNSIGEIV